MHSTSDGKSDRNDDRRNADHRNSSVTRIRQRLRRTCLCESACGFVLHPYAEGELASSSPSPSESLAYLASSLPAPRSNSSIVNRRGVLRNTPAGRRVTHETTAAGSASTTKS